MRQLPEQSGVLTFTKVGTPAALFYIPYLQGIDKRTADSFTIRFNGGEIDVDLRRAEGILFYGASGEIPLDFLDAANRNKVPISFHRTHQSRPYVLTPTVSVDHQDILTRQILHREDSRLRVYIARTLIRARISSQSWLLSPDPAAATKLRSCRSTKLIRAIEAESARRYWRRFYEAAGVDGLTRREPHPINGALDACSRFVSGIVLRWVLFHKLSPAHGFMHHPTSYISLVYDLMEPYRYLLERASLDAWQEAQGKKTTAHAVDKLKERLRTQVFVPVTRQHVYRKALLHGVVLAIRAYLIKDMSRFVIPQEGEKSPGRPIKTSYRLIGEIH